MLKNYLKIAWRNIRKHKLYSVINVVGLSVGVACTLIISLFVIQEMSYDSFHKNSENIYRTTRDITVGDNYYHFAVSPAPLGPALLEEVPEVKKSVRLRNVGTMVVKRPVAQQSFKEVSLVCADSGFFDLFTFNLLEGQSKEQLKLPFTMAISNTVAKKYFPNESPIGKTLILDGEDEYQITGVFGDMPVNSHLQFDFVMSMSSIPDQAQNTNWTSNNFFTYFEIREDADPKAVIAKINEMADKEVAVVLQQYMDGKTLEEFRAEGNSMDFALQPLEDIYLTSDFTFDIGKTGNRSYVVLFGFIAVFIIVLACINFMNLSTARSTHRAKEVGVRKVLGSVKMNLINQFLTESILISLVSFILGMFIVVLVLPYFNNLTDRQLSLPESSPLFIAVILLSTLVVGILAGLYPAFYLSNFKPVETLKGKLSIGTGNGFIRSGLVVFQFFISILLIIGTVSVYKQLRFIQDKKIGFEKDQVILLQDPYMLEEQTRAFKEEVKNIPHVESASYSGFLPVSGYNRSDNTYWPDGEDASESNMVGLQIWRVDGDYVNTMGMELLAGRNFNEQIASDSSSVILNKRAFQMFGFKEGEENYIQTNAFDEETGRPLTNIFEKYKVIGTIEDFHYESMKQNIGPVGLFLAPSRSVLSIKVDTDNFSETLAQLEAVWKKFGPNLPFNYTFLDEDFGNMYNSELRLAQVFSIFAGLAIFIGCLGLFALASFMAEQKAKEIGIRKVLGASVNSILLMFSKQFTKLVIIAFLLAVPLAWWGINSWLGNYSYRVEIGWELYLIAGLIAFAIAWFTVSYHSIRAAISNPIKSLKDE
ncbi:ABC transporter permease [Marivirga atlantica]|jgi:putative ABC transport system permease protein|uniref:ABC transporter permease n=1 Tax=Marivirga atlantica TaxID=1548457 RepID=A0A937DII9_9BACT|nr:ABC transporter permease [Marivirga atlantica]MBL0767073.1 ABC transporter permease [Marivirga atlantica]